MGTHPARHGSYFAQQRVEIVEGVHQLRPIALSPARPVARTIQLILAQVAE